MSPFFRGDLNSMQICLPNGSLELFNKCIIYRKQLHLLNDRQQLPGQLGVNTNVFTKWQPGMSRSKRHYLTQFYSRNEYRECTGRWRWNTNIFTKRRPGNVLPNTILFTEKVSPEKWAHLLAKKPQLIVDLVAFHQKKSLTTISGGMVPAFSWIPPFLTVAC